MKHLAVFATLAVLVLLAAFLCGGPQDHDLGADRASTRRAHAPELRASDGSQQARLTPTGLAAR